MKRILPENWMPIGIDSLELAADATVRSIDKHSVIIAGPGAGKTELLAQRACYLLQTGLCRPPRGILAISFKRDAAKNLGDRVARRCGNELSSYFDSLTFDSFAKSLVDRFRLAIPITFRPSRNYRIDNIPARDLSAFLDALDVPADIGTLADIAALSRKHFLRDFLHYFPLGQEQHRNRVGGWAASQLWQYLLSQNPSILSFPMIGRLAELMLRSNPHIVKALRCSYAFVFLDEFQDTTKVHFDLTRTAFQGSDAILTAVGDNKQRIMGWADALPNAFATFESSSVRRDRVTMRSWNVPGLLGEFLAVSAGKSAPADDMASV